MQIILDNAHSQATAPEMFTEGYHKVEIKNQLTPTEGRRLYNKEDVRRIFQQENEPHNETMDKRRLLYTRVSSPHQVEDLDRQIEFLKSKFPNDEVIKDIASELNWKRKGLQNILELISHGEISEIVVAYKDRLCRFGYEFF